jgi:tRNA pseudouridine38-40 synthase
MFEELDLKVALKYDDLILTNYEDVKTFIDNNQDLFSSIRFDSYPEYQHLYGYTKQNYPIKVLQVEGKVRKIIIKTKDFSNKRLKLILSYDGSAYYGFQVQKAQKTIQGTISALVSQVLNKSILVQGASRTDKQVHALEQVMHFDDTSDLSAIDWLNFLNHQLSDDILIKEVTRVHPLFHSRYDVIQKEYYYQIKLGDKNPLLSNYAWHIEYLDFMRLDDQLKKIVGEHDFTSFSKSDKSDSTRTIYSAKYKMEGDLLKIHITANGFLRYMIRLLIAHIINYATKKTDKDILEIINEKSREHTKDLAPASGLYLKKINY